jgi:hypothetical protein
VRYAWPTVFVLALLARLAWVLSLGDRLQWPDEREFVEIAQGLAAGDGYVSTSFRANPVLPAYLAVVFGVLGESYTLARIGQAVMGAATAVLVGRVAALLVSPAVGLLSGVLVALYVPHVYLAGVFYVDSVLMLLCAVTVYLAARTLKDAGPPWRAFACGVALGLTGLTRGVFLGYLPCVALAWLAGVQAPRARRAALCAALVAGTGVAVLPWTVRNYFEFGRIIPVSSGFATKLWQGNNVLADGGPFDRYLFWNTDTWRARLARLPPQERRRVEERYAEIDRRVAERRTLVADRYLATDGVLLRVALDEMAADPGRVVVLAGRKLRTLFSAFTETATHNVDTEERKRFVAALAFYPMLALAALGLVFGMQRRRDLALLYLLVASVTLTYVALNACTRFRLPIDPYLIVFAALALVEMRRRLSGREPARAPARG